MFRNILVFLALMLPGYLFVKLKIIKSTESAPLSKLLVNVGMPALVFISTANMDLGGANSLNLILVALFSLVYYFVIYFACNPIVKKMGEDNEQKSAKYCLMFQNAGFLGIPLVQAVFGPSLVLDTVVVISVVNCILTNTMGVYIFSRDKNTINFKKLLLNPAIIGFLLGIIVNLTNAFAYVPEIQLFATHLSGIVTPLAMTIVGIKFTEVSFKRLFTGVKTYVVMFIKLIVHPLLIFTILFVASKFIEIPSYIIIGSVISFAMPTSSSATTYADNFKGDTDGAVKYTLSSTVVSAITISLIYYLLNVIF